MKNVTENDENNERNAIFNIDTQIRFELSRINIISTLCSFLIFKMRKKFPFLINHNLFEVCKKNGFLLDKIVRKCYVIRVAAFHSIRINGNANTRTHFISIISTNIF